MYIQNPLNNKYPEILYRSGDLVKYNDRGELLYISRKDSQIKHSGYRIELGEIENAISSFEAIDRVCCFHDESADKIIAVYSLTDGYRDNVMTKTIIEYVGERLPKYMIPNVFIENEGMPLNPNGKIDRKVLKAEYLQGKVQAEE